MSDLSLSLQSPLLCSDSEKDANSPCKHEKAFPYGNAKQHRVHSAIRRGRETTLSPTAGYEDVKPHLQAVLACSCPHHGTSDSIPVVLAQPEGFDGKSEI